MNVKIRSKVIFLNIILLSIIYFCALNHIDYNCEIFLITTLLLHFFTKQSQIHLIKTFDFILEPFSIENNMMTQTLKMKRLVIMKHYQVIIDKMFNS